jgi:EAL and modified HD-GYP domain-containing signal transduction protein
MAPGDDKTQAFIARQPIFDRDRNIVGYELLFRDSFENYFSHPDQNEASSQMITNCSMLFDLSTLTDNRLAFVNATRETLLGEWLTLLPPANTVIEVLETVAPDDEIIEACLRLKRAGYRLALDDFVYRQDYRKLMELADVIKVDVLQSAQEERHEIKKRCVDLNLSLLAEKVEDHQMFDVVQEEGFSLFQGYFFAKPEILVTQDIPANKMTQLRLLQQIQRPEVTPDQLAALLKRDLALSYKLLRYINSAFFGWQVEVHSVRHAIVLLGEKEFRKWASLVVVTSLALDQPQALILQSVFRARFLESLAPLLGLQQRGHDLFLMGLFSMMDVILGVPMKLALKDLPLAEDVQATLLAQNSEASEAQALKPLLVADIFLLCNAYEQGNWCQLSTLTETFNLQDKPLPVLYFQAIEWAQTGL